MIAALLDGVETKGAALVLRGEPGIGKSRLLAEAAELARQREMAVLSATGSSRRRDWLSRDSTSSASGAGPRGGPAAGAPRCA